MQKLHAHKFIKAGKGKVHYVAKALRLLAYLNHTNHESY